MKEGLQRIKISEEHKINGFYTLLTNGSVVCLPDNEYLVPEYVLSILLKSGVNFKIDNGDIEDGDKIKSAVSCASKI